MANRYVVKLPEPTGGKAGKGCNKTSSLQVFDTQESKIVKLFRYRINDRWSGSTALNKANALRDKLNNS